MPEIIPEHVPKPRTLLAWDGTAYRPITIDATGHIQIDVLSTAMDALAATAAHQVTMITALQLIDNLVVALGGPGNVRLIVRGEDQLFSLKNTVLTTRNAVISGNDGFCDSHIVIASETWIITSISAINMTTPTTEIIMMIRRGAVDFYFHQEEAYKSAGRAWTVQLEKHLAVDDLVRVYFIGGLAGDDCWITLTGYAMTLET